MNRHIPKTYSLCLGIDPGIENTGWSLIQRRSGRYQHIDSGVSKASVKLPYRERLEEHWFCVSPLFDGHAIDLVSIEAVFFNKNASSCITTAGVIAIMELRSQFSEIETIQVTPQFVKASVCAGNSDKRLVIRMVNAILKTKMNNHHQADAAAIAIAGFLKIGRQN